MVSARVLIRGEKVQEITVYETLETTAAAVKGIDQKLGDLTTRFGLFGQSAKAMDNRLADIDKKLETLPEKIAQAINTKTRPQ